MTSVAELKERAKAGDLGALQELRDQGFFRKPSAADGYPVSHAQRRLWIVDQMVDGFGAYNIPIALRLDGPLDAAAMRNALLAVMERHESLRTTFATRDGDLRQFVHENPALPWEEIDLADDPAAELRAHQIAGDHAARRFDLAQGPVFQATLIRLAPNRHLFLLNIHHIVGDLTAARILLGELAIGYDAYASGEQPRPPRLPVQYKDLAFRQNEMLAAPEGDRHRSYWLEQMAGPLSPLDLPADFPRPPLKTFDASICRTVLDATLTQDLRQLGLRHGMTLFMVLAAGLKVLLHRYTGQPDITIAFPVAGRDDPDAAGQIGCFINILTLRSRLSAEDSFVAVLAKVRETTLKAYEHQAYPFDRLVEELELPRDMSRSPVFDVLMSFAHGVEGAVQLSGLKASPYDAGYAAAKADMSFDFFELPAGLELAITYSTDLFTAQRVSRMAEHFVRMMRGAVEDPQRSVGRLPLMSPEEERFILVAFNDTARDFQDDKTIVDLLEQHAERAPDAIAATFAGRHLSYRQLNEAANRLALRLLRGGLVTGSIVGLFMESSLDVLTAFLAILKAGGIYLPLDPANPSQRLAAMLEDADVALMLTQASLADRFAAGPKARVLLCDGVSEPVDAQPVPNPARAAGPDDTAYAIFTSGSTGQAKAAVLLHRGLANMISEQAHLFGPHPGDRVLQFAALGFDASVFEFALALAHGATLCLASRDELMPGPDLLATLQRDGITMALLPPSAMAAMPDTDLPMLRVLTVGGDACPAEVVDRWAGGRTFFNLYGPTEATVFATAARCQPGHGTPTIGCPIGNTRIYLLDPQLQPVPLGIPGELCIAGEGLARHYLNRPEMTAARFIGDPFDQRPGARLYRTGDLARYLSNGDIEYLGRIDTQVKLRGYRIELGEIEANLTQHPSVREAIVLAHEAEPGRRQLVAYVTPRTTDVSIDVTGLRQFLRDRLPEYMVPAHVVVLEQMPLTASKKVDRKALAAMDVAPADQAASFIAPRDDVENVLAGLFRDVLKVERVGADGNFFELGGDSLLATRIVSRLRETFRADITIPQLFRAGTVSALAEAVRGALPEARAEKIAGAVLRLQQMSAAEKSELLDRRSLRKAQPV